MTFFNEVIQNGQVPNVLSEIILQSQVEFNQSDDGEEADVEETAILGE